MDLCSKPSVGFLPIRIKSKIPFLGYKAYMMSPSSLCDLISCHCPPHSFLSCHQALSSCSWDIPRMLFLRTSAHPAPAGMRYSQISAWLSLLNASMSTLNCHLSQKLPWPPDLKQPPSITFCPFSESIFLQSSDKFSVSFQQKGISMIFCLFVLVAISFAPRTLPGTW